MKHLNNYKIFENLKNSSYNLQNCNLQVSKLLFGTQTLAEKMIGYKEGGELLKYAYEQGINFWDTSDDYGTHLHVREGIKLVGRKNLKILSKITFYQNDSF